MPMHLRRQYVVVDCLPDAFTGTDLYRPALNTARQLMRGRRIDVILIYAYDRFFREPDLPDRISA